jgi:hypothetical protein
MCQLFRYSAAYSPLCRRLCSRQDYTGTKSRVNISIRKCQYHAEEFRHVAAAAALERSAAGAGAYEAAGGDCRERGAGGGGRAAAAALLQRGKGRSFSSRASDLFIVPDPVGSRRSGPDPDLFLNKESNISFFGVCESPIIL